MVMIRRRELILTEVCVPYVYLFCVKWVARLVNFICLYSTLWLCLVFHSFRLTSSCELSDVSSSLRRTFSVTNFTYNFTQILISFISLDFLSLLYSHRVSVPCSISHVSWCPSRVDLRWFPLRSDTKLYRTLNRTSFRN